MINREGTDPLRLEWDGSYDDDPEYGSGIYKGDEDLENHPGMHVIIPSYGEMDLETMTMLRDRIETETNTRILALFKSKAARGADGVHIAQLYYSVDTAEQASAIAVAKEYGINLPSFLKSLEAEFGPDRMFASEADKAREMAVRAPRPARKPVRKPARKSTGKARKAPSR